MVIIPMEIKYSILAINSSSLTIPSDHQPDVCFTHVGTEVLLISDLSAEADMISSLTRYSILAINSSSLIIPSDHSLDVCFTHCGTDNMK